MANVKDKYNTPEYKKMVESSKNDSEYIIQLNGICKQYDTKLVVNNLNLKVRKGEFLTILGPSGCGKTTTLRMIAGFEIPTKGSIFFNGNDIAALPPYKRNVNTVFQKYALFPHLNVFNNVAFGLKLKKVPVEVKDKNGNTVEKLIPLKNTLVEQVVEKKDGTTVTKMVKFKNQYKIVTVTKKGKQVKKKVNCYKEFIIEKVKRALKIVGLSDYETRDVNSLSGGQQQRVAIARAIINEPQILLLDEPLGALDLKMRQEMQLELKEMHKKLGITFIYVTHDQEEALTMSDTIIVMRDGEICQEGTPIDIYNEPTNAYVADFIGESNILDGVMKQDCLVSFAGIDNVTCVDKGFAPMQPVDVVIRPEDIEVKKEGAGIVDGKIISCMFRGVHYEMECIANGYEFTIQNTKAAPVGSTVGIYVDPDNIHIMKKESLTNKMEVTFTSDNTLSLYGGEYEFNPETFFDGNVKTELKGKKAIVSVDFTKVDLADSEYEAPLAGNVMSMIYKGKNYLVSIRTDDNHHIQADTEYLWDDGDRIGILIKKEDFKFDSIIEE